MRRLYHHRVAVVLTVLKILGIQEGVCVALPSSPKNSHAPYLRRQALSAINLNFRGPLETHEIKARVSVQAAEALLLSIEPIGPDSTPWNEDFFYSTEAGQGIEGRRSVAEANQTTLAGAVAAYQKFGREKNPVRQAGRMISGGYVIYHAIPPRPWRPPQSEAVVVPTLHGNMMVATGALQHRSGFVGAQLVQTAQGYEAKAGFVLHEGTPKRLFLRLLGFSRRLHGTDPDPFVWVVSVDRKCDDKIHRILESIKADPIYEHLRILFVLRDSPRSTILATPKGVSLTSREGGSDQRLVMSWDEVMSTLQEDRYRVVELGDILRPFVAAGEMQSVGSNPPAEKLGMGGFFSYFSVQLDQMCQHLWRYANNPSKEARAMVEKHWQILLRLLQEAHTEISRKSTGWTGLNRLESWNILNLATDQFSPTQRDRIAQIDDLLLALLLPHADLEQRLGQDVLKARLGQQFHPFGLEPTLLFVRQEIDDVRDTLGRFHPGLQVRLQSFYAHWWLRNEHGGFASIPFKGMAQPEDLASLAKVIFLPAAHDLRQLTYLATHEKMHQLLGYLFSKARTLRKSGIVGEADWFTESIAILVVVYFEAQKAAPEGTIGGFKIGIEASKKSSPADRSAFISASLEEKEKLTGQRKRPALLYYDQAAVFAGLAYGDALSHATATGQVDDARVVLVDAVQRIIRALIVPDPLTFDRLIEIISGWTGIPQNAPRSPDHSSQAAA